MNEELIQALQAVVQQDNNQTRRALYQALLKGTFYMPAATGGEELHPFLTPDAQGRQVLPVFTDPKLCEVGVPKAADGAILAPDAIFRIAVQNQVAAVEINPTGPAGVRLLPWEFQLLAHGRIPTPTPEPQPQAATGAAIMPAQIQKPAWVMPDAGVASLREILSGHPEIMAGYVFDLASGEPGPTPSLGVRFSASLAEQYANSLSSELQGKIQALPQPASGLKVTPLLDRDFLRMVREAVKPIYLRA